MSDTEKKKPNWEKVAQTTVMIAGAVVAAGKVVLDQLDKSKQ